MGRHVSVKSNFIIPASFKSVQPLNPCSSYLIWRYLTFTVEAASLKYSWSHFILMIVWNPKAIPPKNSGSKDMDKYCIV
jgi:hypothetical protein